MVAQILTVLTGTPVDKATVSINLANKLFHFPDYIFWYKVQRFLRGTFHDFEDQCRMAARFDPNNKDYARFVEDLISTINQLENTGKVDCFACFTRAFFLAGMEKALYFKMVKYILLCTYDELLFIKECPYEYESQNTIEVSALYQYGLFTQITKGANNETFYILSDFAKALKQNCLNFEEGTGDEKRLLSYQDLKPLNIDEPATIDDISRAFYEHIVTEVKE